MQEFNPEEQNGQNKRGSFLTGLNPIAYVFVVLAIIFFLYQFIGGALALAAGDISMDDPDVKVTRLILAFGQFMFILAPAIFFARFQTHDLKNIFRLHSPKPVLLLLAVLGIITIQPFLQGYMYFQESLLSSIPYLSDTLKPLKEIFEAFEKSTMKIVKAHNWFEFSVVVFVICITPAICEEALFRGFALSNISKVTTALSAILITGFFFAMYHFQPFNFVPLLILGCFLGFIVYYSNSIYTGVLAHFLNNFFASYYMFMYGKTDFETPKLTEDEITNTIAAVILSVILFAGIIILYYRLRVKTAELPVVNESRKNG